MHSLYNSIISSRSLTVFQDMRTISDRFDMTRHVTWGASKEEACKVSGRVVPHLSFRCLLLVLVRAHASTVLPVFQQHYNPD